MLKSTKMSGSTVPAITTAAAPVVIERTNEAHNPNICRYFLRGVCRFGDLCYFSHDPTGGEVIQSSGNNKSNASASAAMKPPPPNQPSTSKNAICANWANAPVFVPSYQRQPGAAAAVNTINPGGDNASHGAAHKTWADVVGAGVPSVGIITVSGLEVEAGSLDQMCPYENPCPYGVYCTYALHWEMCEMCDQHCLHPTDQVQRRKHNRECLQQHERDMELSFAVARSKDKTCGICFDTILEKSGREKRFGILPNCSHIFCLECIRKWRQAKQFEHKITRSCPECRVSSDFVCPSDFWVETKEEKDKLLGDYRTALGIKDCKYFKKGDGKCPFGNKCFYKHALPNGDLVDVGVPKRSRKLYRNTDELMDMLDIYLWEFVDQRDYHWLEMLGSDDSDESDDSDYD